VLLLAIRLIHNECKQMRQTEKEMTQQQQQQQQQQRLTDPATGGGLSVLAQ